MGLAIGWRPFETVIGHFFLLFWAWQFVGDRLRRRLDICGFFLLFWAWQFVGDRLRRRLDICGFFLLFWAWQLVGDGDWTFVDFSCCSGLDFSFLISCFLFFFCRTSHLLELDSDGYPRMIGSMELICTFVVMGSIYPCRKGGVMETFMSCFIVVSIL
jgi:hypothetical protein